MKFKIGRYYERLDSSRIYKCIEQEKNVYFFKRVDGNNYGANGCSLSRRASTLCSKCTTYNVCSRAADIKFRYLKEVTKLKAILLYEE